MNPTAPQTIDLTKLSLEQLNNLLAQAQAQVLANTAQQSLVAANAKVQVDNLVTQNGRLQTNVTAIQAAIAKIGS